MILAVDGKASNWGEGFQIARQITPLVMLGTPTFVGTICLEQQE